jgi:hypothetical protein
MIKVRLCVPFYSEFDWVLESIENDIIPNNNLSYQYNNSNVLDWFEYKNYRFYFEPRHSTRIKDGRNSLISDVINSRMDQKPLDFDYFFFIDSDIKFTLKHLMKLLEQKKQVIGSPYLTHDSNSTYNICDLNTNGQIEKRYNIHTKGLKQVHAVAGGFTCIERNVFFKLKYPWFREPMITWDNGKFGQETGEDVGFCVYCKENGIPIFCDFDNQVQHRQRKQMTFRWTLKNR